MMLSDVCMSVAYIGPKSRTERPRKTKIGTVVAHVTRDSDTTFKVTRSSADADNRLDAFSGQSRSTNMVPFHMLHIVSYCAIVTLSLRRAVFMTFDFNK